MSDERAGFLSPGERRARSESSKISSPGKSQRDFEPYASGISGDNDRPVFLGGDKFVPCA
jgi:hypothetical protein